MPFTAESAKLARQQREVNKQLRLEGKLPPLPPRPVKKVAKVIVKAKPSYVQPDPPGRVSLREHDVHGISDVVDSRTPPPVEVEFDFLHSPLNECEKELERLRAVVEIGSRTVEARRSQQPRVMWHCAVCGVPVEDGKWKFKDDSRRDPQTGLVSPAVTCSITCYTRYWSERPRLGPRK